MKETFTVTRELLASAKTYMPLAEKVVAASAIAESVLADNKGGAKLLPPLVREDTALKSVLLVNTFLKAYFNIDMLNNEKADIYERYDYYAGGGLFCQLEVYKADAELKGKVYMILADYKELRKMVEVEITNIKTARNSALERISAAADTQVTPEALKALAEELKGLAADKNEPQSAEVSE